MKHSEVANSIQPTIEELSGAQLLSPSVHSSGPFQENSIDLESINPQIHALHLQPAAFGNLQNGSVATLLPVWRAQTSLFHT